jgi:hypothetical protein
VYSYTFWGEHFGFFLVYYCEGWTELAAKFENSKEKKKKILHLLIYKVYLLLFSKKWEGESSI